MALQFLGRFTVHRRTRDRLDVHLDDQALSNMAVSPRWSLAVCPGTDLVVLSANPEGNVLQMNATQTRSFPHRLQFSGKYVEKMPTQPHRTRPFEVVQVQSGSHGTLVVLAPVPEQKPKQEQFTLEFIPAEKG